MGKNLNFKNWGRSIGKLFGGGKKNAGPPPNTSKYSSINTTGFTGGQVGMNNFNSNSTLGSLPCNGDCDGWLGTEFIGPTPIATYYKRETPVDIVDLAAQKHDAGYILMGADGISGALFDLSVLKYDKILVNDAKKAYSDYYNYGIDSQTMQPISFQTQLRAAGVVTLFSGIVELKQGLLNLRTTYQSFVFSRNHFFNSSHP